MTASAAPAGCEITGEPDCGAEKCKGLATEEKRKALPCLAWRPVGPLWRTSPTPDEPRRTHNPEVAGSNPAPATKK